MLWEFLFRVLSIIAGANVLIKIQIIIRLVS